MLAVIKIFQIEKFLRDFAFSRISLLNISAFYIQVPYKSVPYKKAFTLYDHKQEMCSLESETAV